MAEVPPHLRAPYPFPIGAHRCETDCGIRDHYVCVDCGLCFAVAWGGYEDMLVRPCVRGGVAHYTKTGMDAAGYRGGG